MGQTLMRSLVPALLILLGSRSALAAERPCTAMRIEAEPNVRRLWPELEETVREALEDRSDVDACAHVTIGVVSDRRHDRITIGVVLPDGRTTSRSVDRHEDVIPTLEGLLLMPLDRAEDTAPAMTVETAAVVPVEAVAPLPTRDVQRDLPRNNHDAANRVRIELSVMTGARFGDRHGSVGAGLLSFLDVGGWLGGFSARADYFQAMDGSPPGADLSLTVLGGRRFRFDSVSIDLVGGPSLALQGTNTSVFETPATGRRVVETTYPPVPRVVLGARLNFRARSALRAFVGVDGERALSQTEPATIGDVPQLPIWSLGFAVGATVGTL